MKTPDILELDENEELRFVHDGEEIEEVLAKEVQQSYQEYSSLIFILEDLTNGMIQLDLNTYKTLPARFISALKLYKSLRIQSEIEQIKKK